MPTQISTSGAERSNRWQIAEVATTTATSEQSVTTRSTRGLSPFQHDDAPGRTHERTHYTLTEQGREALREWLATPARFPRIQNEPVVRLLGAEYADRGVLLQSLQSLRAELDELDAAMRAAEQREAGLPQRATVLRLNRRLAQRILDAHRAWLDELEQEL